MKISEIKQRIIEAQHSGNTASLQQALRELHVASTVCANKRQKPVPTKPIQDK